MRKAAGKVVWQEGKSLGKFLDKAPGGVCLNCGFDIWPHDYDEGESCPPYTKRDWENYKTLSGPTVVLSLLDRIEELERDIEMLRKHLELAHKCQWPEWWESREVEHESSRG